MNRKELERMRPLPVLGFVLAIFLAFNISVFAIEDEANNLPAEGEVIEAELELEEPVVKPNNLEAPNVLLESYIEKSAPAIVEEAMMGSAPSVASENMPIKSARFWRLSEAEQNAYLKMREMLEAVSKGEISDASVEISLADIFEDVRYTAEELGIDSIVVELGEGDEKELVITSEAENAIMENYSLDADVVIKALMFDYPELLFWYDKTEGVVPDSNYCLSADINTETGEYEIWCDDRSSFSYSFTVSRDYAPEDSTDEYTVDVDKIASVDTAINNAAAIIDYAKDEEDKGKLSYYKDRICENVSYNDDVADDSNNVPYGDPWQFVYVFDNDPNTNVVCEGYSKAFKYLCDWSVFDDNNFSCNVVTGLMGSPDEDAEGIVGGGRHMWNLVCIGDQNYLVDLTNCDEGCIGFNEYLFMRGDEAEDPSGYTIVIPERSDDQFSYPEAEVVYAYNDETKKLFGPEELTLTEKDYLTGKAIIKAPIGKTLTYNTKPQTGVASGKGYMLSGDPTAINAGTYTATASLDNDYEWGDGTTEPKEITWTINKAVSKVTVPKGKTITYNAKAQTGIASGSNYTLSGTIRATKAGTYSAKATLKANANYSYKWADGTTSAKIVKWTIKKAANPLTIKAKTKNVSFAKLKKKKLTYSIGNVIAFSKKGQGAVTYAKASGNKGITINKKTGAVTVKKGLKKGTYKVKVMVTAAGNANYNKATKAVTSTIRVK